MSNDQTKQSTKRLLRKPRLPKIQHNTSADINKQKEVGNERKVGNKYSSFRELLAAEAPEPTDLSNIFENPENDPENSRFFDYMKESNGKDQLMK